ncbi:hypothetical protein ACX0G9_21885 [Flavitalea flava]
MKFVRVLRLPSGGNRLRLLLALLPVILISTAARSQKAIKDSSAECLANWKTGEEKIYSIVHTKSTRQSGQEPSAVRFSYEVHVKVVDSTASEYTIQWVYHLTPEMKEELMKQPDPLPIFDGMQVIYTISEVGAYKELFNWEEVRDNYLHMLESSLSQNPSNPPNQDSASKAAILQAKKLFQSKEMVEGALIKEILVYHHPYGYSFSTKDLRVETELSNPFGGRPLPAIQSFRITKLDPQHDRFTLAIRQNIEKGRSKPIFDEVIKKRNIKNEGELKKLLAEMASFEINDSTEYIFIQSSGWISHLLYFRKATQGGITQTDAFTIDLKN